MADGLQKTGVELVAEGQAAFTAAINKATASLNVFERANKLAAAAVNALGEIGIGALRRIGELGVNALVRAGREVLRFGQNALEAAAQGSHFNTTLDNLGNRLLSIIRFNIDPLLDQFDGLVQKSQPAIEGWVAFLSRSFATLGQNALSWGENIAGQLAQGIYDGAQMVLDALIYLGQLITNLLMPGSPPKLLPDLDTWGTEAANVYLEGWTKADFGILASIGSSIEGLLRSQAGRNDTGLIPRILGTREAIAQAVAQAREFGRVTTEALQAIYRAAGTTNPAVQQYLKSAFDLEFANQALKTSQDELNQAQEKYRDLLKPIDQQLASISEAQQQFTEDQEKSRLRLILADPNATAAEKQQALLRLQQIDAERNRRALVAEQATAVDAAQTKVDAAQKAVDAAQAEYDARKANLDLLTEQNRLFQEQASLLDRLAQAAAKAGGGGKGGGGVNPLGIEIPEAIQEKLDALVAKLNILRAAWQLAWALIKASPIFDNIQTSLETLTTFWAENQVLILGATRAAFTAIVAIIVGSLGIITGVVAAALVFLKGLWDGTLLLLQGRWREAFNTIIQATGDALVILRDSIAFALDTYLGLFGTSIAQINQKWVSGLNAMSRTTTSTLQRMSDDFNAGLNGMSRTTTSTLQYISDEFNGKLQGMSNFINAWLNATAALFVAWGIQIANVFLNTDWAALGRAIIDGIVAGLLGAVGNLVSAAVGAATAALGAALGALPGGGGAGSTVAPPASGGYSTGGNSSSVTNNYNYSPSYNGAPVAPQLDFAAMNTWAAS